MPIKYPTIDRVDRLSAADFNRHYLGRQAVLFTEQTGAWRGLTKWTHAYLKGIKCSRPVKIRPPRESHLAATRVTQYVEMNEYVHMMETHEEGVKNGSIS